MDNTFLPPDLARALVLGQVRFRAEAVEAIAREGQDMLTAGRQQDAASIFEGLTLAAPHSFLGWAGLGAVALAADDVAAAEGWLSEAMKLAPADAAVYANYAETLQRLGKPEEAQQALQQALRLDPAAEHPCTARILEFMRLLP